MPNIEFATQETLIKPVGGLINQDRDENDHVLGAALSGPDFEILIPDGQWETYLPASELQRNNNGDTFMCVSFSHQNCCEFIISRRYGEILNMSDIALGVMSGTVRGQGNGKRTVAECARVNGFVLEEDYPYTEKMTLDQVYSPVPASIKAKAKENLKKWSLNYKWVSDNTPRGLQEALKYSPVQVDVTGGYEMDSRGIVVYDGQPYIHEVTIFGYEPGVCWYVFDSEASQYIRFAWNYKFGSPMIHSIKKKMQIQILKEKGNSALAVKHFSEPCLIAFSGGSVEAQALFKSLYGIVDFSQLPIIEVDKFPFPISHLINTNVVK